MKSKLETIKRDVYDDIKDIISLDKIEEIALKTKFIQRNKNKITAENFFNLNIFSEVNICKDSLNNLCNLLFVEENVLISPQALDERFNEKAVNFFKEVFMEVFSNCLSRLSIKSTNQFNRIIITDSTGFQLPSEFKDIFKGSNGSASEAGIKFQVTNDLLTGNIVSLDISDGRESDCKYLNKLEKLADKGDLCLKDLGYFSLKHLKELKENESYYISKLKKNTNVFVENKELEYFKDGRIKKESIYKKLDLVEESKKMSTNETKELEVYIGSNKSNRIKARMIIFKFSDDITKEREAKMKRATSKKGQTVSENSKLLSNVNFLITNVASNELSKELIYLVYTLRWQIELMFKVWKSIFNIDKVKKVKRERFLCHIYGSLISILISSNLVFSIRNTVSQKLKKEISEYKTFKTVFVFLKKSGIRLFKSYSSLKIFLNKIIEIILKNGIKSKKDNVRSSGEILNLIKKEILNCKLIA